MPIEPQSVDAPLLRVAVFLVVTIGPGAEALARARSVIADIGSLVRAVGFRHLDGHLSCNVGIGSDAWDRLGQAKRPSQLHAFSEVRGATHAAVATPGTYSSTSAPSAATCVSSWKGSSSVRSATPSPS